MKLKDARDAYYEASGAASGIIRTLALASIGLVWVLREDAKASKIPQELWLPALLTVISLGCDLMQYLVKTASWGIYHRCMEKRDDINEESEFEGPIHLNWGPLVLFWGKAAAMAGAYAFLLAYILGRY